MTTPFIKTAGEWSLDVLGCPFGSNTNRDAHGEWFSPHTQFHAEQIPLPPVVYYHGFDPQGQPQGTPEFIGKTVRRWIDEYGVWYRVVLNQSSAFARRVWQAARDGVARASTGTMAHLRRVGRDGHINHWLVSELSLFDAVGQRQPANRYAVAVPVLKAIYQQAGLALPEEVHMENEQQHGEQQISISAADLKRLLHQAHQAGSRHASSGQVVSGTEALKGVLAEFASELGAGGQQRPLITTTPADIQQLIASERADWQQHTTARNRLPIGGGEGGFATPLKFGELRKYDHLSAADQAVLCGILMAPHRGAGSRPMVSEAALKALSFKLDEDRSEIGAIGRSEMKARGIKAGEIMGSGVTDYGEEWVGVAYSTALWQAIRNGTFVAQKVRHIEIPPGVESMKLPLEGTDPTFYNVAEASTYGSGVVTPTIGAKGAKSERTTLSLAKLGARTIFTGELSEDSVIPIASQLRLQLAEAGAENLEWVIIDGDTVTSADNINSGASIPGTTVYTVFDGFRKVALGGGTATVRSAGGYALAVEDFIKTAQLMGEAGYAALDSEKVGFLIPLSVHWRFMTMAHVMTSDKVANPTIEEGILKRIFGIPVYTSAQMLRAHAGRKTYSDGKMSSSASLNTLGVVMCVRWDQWTLGWRRRMTLETVRRPESDTTDIVAMMRCGLVHRQTKTAAAMTTNISLGDATV